MKWRTTPRQSQRLRALVRQRCANCMGGRCLLLDEKCPQLYSVSGIYCRCRRDVVLPGDRKFLAEIKKQNHIKTPRREK